MLPFLYLRQATATLVHITPFILANWIYYSRFLPVFKVAVRTGMVRHIFVILPSTKFHVNSPTISRVVICVQTDRRDDFNSLCPG